VTDAVEPVVENVTDTVEPVVENVTDAVEPVVEKVTDTVEPVVENVTDTVAPIVDEVTGTVDDVTDAVEPVLDGATDAIGDLTDPILDEVTETVDDLTDPILGDAPSDDDAVGVRPQPDDDPIVSGPPGSTAPGPGATTAFLLGDARSAGETSTSIVGVTTSWITGAPASGVLTTFTDIETQRARSSSVVPVGAPPGGPGGTGAFAAAGLFAILALCVRLLLPRMRSTNAHGTAELRSAALALSVERPG